MACQCEDQFKELTEYIRSVFDPEHPQSALISILHEANDRCGYLSREVMDHISTVTEIPTAEIYGVATFYSYFKLKPQGKHYISVCMGTACYIRGAAKVLEAFEEELDVKVGDTTDDSLFTLGETRCIGACGLAPVVMVDEKVYANVEPKQVREIIADYKK